MGFLHFRTSSCARLTFGVSAAVAVSFLGCSEATNELGGSVAPSAAGVPGQGGPANQTIMPNVPALPGASPVQGVSPVQAVPPPSNPVVPAPAAEVTSEWSASGLRLVRLSHFQWQNSVLALLGIEVGTKLEEELTPDGVIDFDNAASQLIVSSTLREDYERVSEQLATALIENPAAMKRLAPEVGDPAVRAKTFIESFGLKAYRRPLSEEEVQTHLSLFNRGSELAPDLDPFAAGIMLTVRLVLQSPLFLYRTELGLEAANGRVVLSPYEVAAKVALATTAAGPDDALLQAAASGALGKDPAVLKREVDRLLNSPAGKASAQHFHKQLYALSRYDQISKDSDVHPEFTQNTPKDMRTSVELFLDDVYEGSGGLKALLTSPTQFVNSTLAPIYGVEGEFGEAFEPVDLSAKGRAGLMTNVGLLSVYAFEYQPDAIHRGVFVAENILCLPLPSPVDNVPPLPPEMENQTNRERVDSATGKGTCGEGCHSNWINPLGFAFKGYDALGRVRTMDGDQPVDSSGEFLLDGEFRPFANGVELVSLMADSNQATDCYTKRWLSYLQGRALEPVDDAYVRHLRADSAPGEVPIKQLIAQIVTDPSFITRQAEGSAQ